MGSTQFAMHLGHRIAYDVTGRGSPVVLQHGFLSYRRTWHDVGYVRTLADAYRVICIDSLGHGESDKPDDPARYARQARAGDVAAVLDAEGIDRAHYIGYSMGGWIGTGMMMFEAERLRSIVLGGWDPSDDARAAARSFDEVIASVRQISPAHAAAITPESRPALAACWIALADREGSIDALRRCRVPRMLWIGRDDPFASGVFEVAAEIGIDVLEVAGDHIAARMVHSDSSAGGLRGFLDRATQA